MDFGLSKNGFNTLIADAFAYVRPLYDKNSPSHDLAHVQSVFSNVAQISSNEEINPQISLVSAIFHDVIQDKGSGGSDVEQSASIAKEYLLKRGLNNTLCKKVYDTIIQSSWEFFEKTNEQIDKECLLLRDADILESIGTIGIARAFSYSGENGIPFGFSSDFDKQTVKKHFSEKLMILMHVIHFDSAKKEAILRHNYMLSFIEEYTREINWSQNFHLLTTR